MSAKIPPQDMVKAAREFALPQVSTVQPRLVVRLGLQTFCAMQRATDRRPSARVADAIASPYGFEGARIWCQAHTGGLVTSMVALRLQGQLIERVETLDMASHLSMIADEARRQGWSDAEFTERVKRKQAKFQRHDEKFEAASRARASLAVSLNPGKGRKRTGSKSP